MRSPRYTQQCEELSRESEELRHTTMVRTDLLLHKKRQEVRDVEREYKNAVGDDAEALSLFRCATSSASTRTR